MKTPAGGGFESLLTLWAEARRRQSGKGGLGNSTRRCRGLYRHQLWRVVCTNCSKASPWMRSRVRP